MQIEPSGPPEVSPLPAGLAVRTYRDEDAEPLRAALNEAFVDGRDWHDVSAGNFREFFLRARGFDPALWLLAFDGDELAGFSLAYAGRGGDPELGWIGTLGVRRPWRRRGLGEALLRRSFAALYDRGFRRVGLGVDAENPTGARRLYERAGMRAIRQQDRWERRA
jgi:ribosomal protein S18 acetylase RimI-like enzyme